MNEIKKKKLFQEINKKKCIKKSISNNSENLRAPEKVVGKISDEILLLLEELL